MTDKINEDWADIYAAMDELEAEEASERSARNPFLNRATSDKTVTVTVDGKPVEVPSLEYVRGLEQLIRAQAHKLEKYERQFHRIDAKLRTQRAHINGQAQRINSVNHELDQKIDRRD